MASAERSGHSVFVRWLFSYLGLLGVLVVVNGFAYYQATRALAAEIEEGRAALLRQAEEAIAGRASDLERISLQLSWNPRVRSFLYRKPPLDGSSYYLLAELNRDIQALATANGFVRELFIYFRGASLALSTRTVARMDMLDKTILDEFPRPLEEWVSLLESRHFREMLPLDGGLYYLQSLPLDSPDEPPATMVAALDSRWLQNTIHNPTWLAQESIFIVDAANRLVASAGEQHVPEQVLSEWAKHDEGPPRLLHCEGGRYVVSVVRSRTAGWRIVSVLPSQVYLRKALYLRDLTVVSLAICVVLGGGMAWLFSRKNALDLRALVADMAALAGIRAESGANEYRFLKSAIAATLQERERNREALREFNRTMRNHFLVRLLKGQMRDERAIVESLETYGLRMDWGRFGVLAFYWERAGAGTEDDARGRLTQAILAHQVEACCDGRFPCAVAEIDDMLIAIVGGIEAEGDLRCIAEQVQKVASAQTGVTLTAAFSACHEGPLECGTAFRESLDALEHRLVRGKGAIIGYSSTAGSSGIVELSVESEQELARAVRAGSLERAEPLMESIMDRALCPDASMQAIKCFIFDLHNTLLRAFADASEGRKRALIEIASPCLKATAASSLDEVRERLRAVLREVCRFAAGASRDARLAEAVRSFVLDSYPDPNLSIAAIADHFRLTQGYISRRFREACGESLLDFIHKVRVRAAKNLLAPPRRVPLGEVARAVGYASSDALIRAFKKYEGITPGRYAASA